ncbi:hypothetical protein [Micromonospora sp. NPDC048898]|uniref:hypothetical protein n=1 Tax=Micromonospora sp. NPDC048898 TaxID=3364260 RepID=UPI003710811B
MASNSAKEIADRLTKREARFTKQVKFLTSPEEHERFAAYARARGWGEGAAIRHAISLMLEGDEE